MKLPFAKLFAGDPLKRYRERVDAINALEARCKEYSKEGLITESNKLRARAESGEPLDALLPEAFALVREASRRSLGQRHYDVQLIGGMVLHEGKIAEMMTGEGKTLVATLPVYLNALGGKGVHVVTVNDYLARRDAVWMGQIYHALGLKVACIVHNAAYAYDPLYEETEEEKADAERDAVGGFRVVEKFLRPVSRGEAYAADVVYGTNHEFGFDYLRDNLEIALRSRVQSRRSDRDSNPAAPEHVHNFVIIDEVDSILIDEARTPLIISAPDRESSEYYRVFARAAAHLETGTDYELDEKLRTAHATDAGLEKIERILKIDNIFAPEHSRLVHFLHESLKAHALFKRDRDYVVKNDEIIIVDEFTGRMLPGRRYSGGLHQALEAKENVRVKEENRTYATITIQNYFRMYRKIAGMTGTAETSAEEFHKVYGLDVVSIPPNKAVARKDAPDVIYKNKDAKFRAIVEEIKKRYAAGQPVLLGTTSIINNELVARELAEANIPHEILNAKNHEREGAIIAQAGRRGAVTVATNMAGRGVDIILGGNPPDVGEASRVREAGGLHVIGTERHEARRIDNQLRGRSGRQGDPGSSQFFLSLEDDLLRIFGGERIQRLMGALNFPEDQPIESKMISRSVAQAQAKVEGANLDIRRHLLDFDDVLNKQRSAIYGRRIRLLEAGERGEILSAARELVEKMKAHMENAPPAEADEMREAREKQLRHLENRLEKFPASISPEKSVMLGQGLVRIIDALWVDHLEHLESLRESVNIRAYGQHEPLVEYRREAHRLFRELEAAFESLAVNAVFELLEMDESKVRAAEKKPESISFAVSEKVGRNDPCPCGSGKKYKRCHGA